MELKSSINLVFMQPSSPHEMFILLGENNKLFDALIFNPVHTKEKTDVAATQAVAASVFQLPFYQLLHQ